MTKVALPALGDIAPQDGRLRLAEETFGPESFALLRRTLLRGAALELTGCEVVERDTGRLRLRGEVVGLRGLAEDGEAPARDEDKEGDAPEAPARSALADVVIEDDAAGRRCGLLVQPRPGDPKRLADRCLASFDAGGAELSALALEPFLVFSSVDRPEGDAPAGLTLWPAGLRLRAGINVAVRSLEFDPAFVGFVRELVGNVAFGAGGTAAVGRILRPAIPPWAERRDAAGSAADEGTPGTPGDATGENGDGEASEAVAAEPLALGLVIPPPAPVALTFGGFSATLSGVELTIPVAGAAAGTELGLILRVGAEGGDQVELHAGCDLASGIATLRMVESPPLSDFLSFGARLFDGGATADNFLASGPLSKLLAITVPDAWIAIDLTGNTAADEAAATEKDGSAPAALAAGGPSVLSLGFEVAAAEPIPLFVDALTFSPRAVVRIDHPFSTARRRVQGLLEGTAQLGTAATATARLRLPQQSFEVGFEVRLDEAATALGAPAEGAPAELAGMRVRLDISGDLSNGAFDARLALADEGATWSPSAGGKALTLRELVFGVSRGDAKAPVAFSLLARLTLGSAEFTIDGGHAGGWFLGGTMAGELDLSDAARDMFDGGAPTPDGAGNLKLGAVELSADLRDGAYSISGSTAGPWKPFADFAMTIDLRRFRFAKAKAKGVTVDIAATLGLGPVVLDLAATRTPADTGWRFAGELAQELDLSELANDIAKQFGVAVAEIPAGFKLKKLSLEVDTGRGSATFACAGTAPAGNRTVEAEFVIKVAKDEAGSTVATVGLRVKIENLTFDGRLRSAADETLFGGSLQLKEHAGRVDLRPAVVQVAPGLGDLVPDLALDVEQVLFAYRSAKGEEAAFLFDLMLKLEAVLDLGEALPIGDAIGAPRIALQGLRARFASADLSQAGLKAVNDLLPEGLERIPAAEGGGEPALAHGLNLSAALSLGGGKPKPLALTSPPEPKPAKKVENGRTATPADDDAKWFEIGRALGPLHLGRAGIAYRDGKLGLLLDSAIDLAGLRVGLTGFGVRFPLSMPLRPEFELAGLELGYRAGPVQISGAFLKTVADGLVRYDGMALVKTPALGITGIGSYAQVDGAPSLFLFAALHAALGGPPPFRVRGVAAGFGYNRTLTLPPIEKVHEFPLVRAAMDADFFATEPAKDAVGRAMTALRTYIAPSAGDYWLAAGIRFSSFELIESVALVSVSFGHEIEIGMLGLSRLTLPKGARGDSVIAYAELALRVSIKPETGSVAVEGRLTDESFIFSRDCRLTGGFAFYFWFGGAHAGDFVATLGGYHPAFVPPDHYPVVPRLGVNWQVTPELKIVSEMYFALTPSCLMAGGRLAATYRSDGVRAWFIAYADFLIMWEPLYYSAKMGVSIGVEADLELFTVEFELDVDLEIWGPAFGGRLAVDLTVFSFTVDFGANRSPPEKLTAEQFRAAFLPDPTTALAVRVADGLISERKRKGATIRTVRAHGLRLEAQSPAPITSFIFGDQDDTTLKVQQGEFGVAPMAKAGLASTFQVSLVRIDETGAEGAVLRPENVARRALDSHSPAALWRSTTEVAIPNAPPKKDEMTMPATLGAGLDFAPLPPKGALPPMRLAVFRFQDFPKDGPPPLPGDLRAEGAQGGLDGIASTAVAARTEILKAIAARAPFELAPVDLSLLAAKRDSYFQAEPEIAALGSLGEGRTA